jgi:hypothetical protein
MMTILLSCIVLNIEGNNIFVNSFHHNAVSLLSLLHCLQITGNLKRRAGLALDLICCHAVGQLAEDQLSSCSIDIKHALE